MIAMQRGQAPLPDLFFFCLARELKHLAALRSGLYKDATADQTPPEAKEWQFEVEG
jgi:hypothetical protein